MSRIDDDVDDDLINQFKTATVTLAYLNTNGTSHASPLAALAELTDNSKDARATEVRIDFVERDGLETIEVQDNGEGMTPQEVASIIAFGHSNKRNDNTHMIGRYGNGLKSGGLRLGSELLLLTKKNGTYTALLISNHFNQKRGHEQQVFVPCPSFNQDFEAVTNNKKLHAAEVKVINKYGPIGNLTLQDLLKRIPGSSGTLIIIDKLKRDFHCRLELNFSNKHDIQLDQDDAIKWKTSLRAYLEILYQDSNMKIILCGKQVEEKFLFKNWMFRRKVTKANLQCKEIHALLMKEAEDKCSDLKSKMGDIQSQIAEDNNRVQLIRGDRKTSHNLNHTRHQEMSEAFKKAEAEKNELKIKQGRPVATVFFSIGVNVEDRSADGIYFYLNNRLIKGAFKGIKFYNEKSNLGIAGKVNFTYDLFLPTQSKTDFANQKDFQLYLNLVKNWLKIYVHELQTDMIPNFLKQLPRKIDFNSENIMSKFWMAVGYSTEKPSCIRASVPDGTVDLIQRDCRHFRKCELCGIWRGAKKDISSGAFVCQIIGWSCQSEGGGHNMLLSLKTTIDKVSTPKKKIAPMRNHTINQPKPIEPSASRSETDKLSQVAERLADDSRPRRSGTKRDYKDDSPVAPLDDRKPHRDERHLYRTDANIDAEEDTVEVQLPSKKLKTSRRREVTPIGSRSPSPSRPSTSGPVASTSSRSRPSASSAFVKPSAVAEPPSAFRSDSSSSSFNSSPCESPKSSRRPPLVLEKPFVSEPTGYHLHKPDYDKYRHIMKNLETVMAYWAANPPSGLDVGRATQPTAQLATVAEKIRELQRKKNEANTSQFVEPKREPKTPIKLGKRK